MIIDKGANMKINSLPFFDGAIPMMTNPIIADNTISLNDGL